ncbi:hypothetical protein D3C80_1602220 [compost metagenome]
MKNKQCAPEVRDTFILLVAFNIIKKLFFYSELSSCKRHSIFTNVSDGFYLTFELLHNMGRISRSTDCHNTFCFWNVLSRCDDCGATQTVANQKGWSLVCIT